jgi:hypothetical protein
VFTRRILVQQLRNNAGQQGYAPATHNMYNMFSKEDDTDTTYTTMMNITVLTLGSTFMATIPVLVANAINQLSTNQTALMNQMTAISYTNIPLPSSPSIPTTSPTTHHSSAATSCHSHNRQVQSWKWRRQQGGGSRQGHGRCGGRHNQRTPFANYGCNQDVGGVGRGRGGGRITQAPGALTPQLPTFVSPNARNIAMPFLNAVKSYANCNVCYTCRFDMEEGHTSAMCHKSWKKSNHQEGFTRANLQEYLNVGWDPCTKGIHRSQLQGY